MKKSVIIGVILVLVLLVLIVGFYTDVFDKITGKVVSEQNSGEEHQIGPNVQEQACMKKCVTDAGCTIGDVACSEKNNCMTQCNLKKPEVTEETSCMEKCVLVGCGEFDFSCQGENKDKCEKECNMIKEPEAKSEEEQCIRDCVNLHAPKTICKPSSEGEQGNDVCQMCAQQCVHLYAGPCLNEEKLEAAKQECQTCDNCYGEPKMGDSGEGWECIVSVECKDASSEFGDEPGTGEGIVAKVGDVAGNVVEAIGNFFKGIFGGGEDKTAQDTENPASQN